MCDAVTCGASFAKTSPPRRVSCWRRSAASRSSRCAAAFNGTAWTYSALSECVLVFVLFHSHSHRQASNLDVFGTNAQLSHFGGVYNPQQMCHVDIMGDDVLQVICALSTQGIKPPKIFTGEYVDTDEFVRVYGPTYSKAERECFEAAVAVKGKRFYDLIVTPAYYSRTYLEQHLVDPPGLEGRMVRALDRWRLRFKIMCRPFVVSPLHVFLHVIPLSFR